MADQLHIDHAELSSHAGKLDQLASDLAGTGSEASAINLHGGAFGKLLGWLPTPIQALTPSQAGAITAAQGTVSRTASAIRVLAADFTDTDKQIADKMNKIKG